ncbi:MAG: hypothetical protein Kow00109_29830 [Acidobacteriota bacterium]
MAVEAIPTTILLIEPDQALRRRYRKFLEFAGFRVLTRENLQDFQTRPVDETAVDVVVLPEADISHPAWQPWLAEHPRTHIIPVTDPSGSSLPPPPATVFAAGPPERLVSRIRRTLGRELRLSSCA